MTPSSPSLSNGLSGRHDTMVKYIPLPDTLQGHVNYYTFLETLGKYETICGLFKINLLDM